MNSNEKLLAQIINDKHKETLRMKEKGIFEKANKLKANEIGQVGEQLVKKIITDELNLEISQKQDETIHKPYDISVKNGKEMVNLEVKTARLDRNNRFQFNNIKPNNNNCEHIVCIGIKTNEAFGKVIDGKIIEKDGKKYLDVKGKLKKLTPMSPNNLVSFKLTLMQEDLEPIENLNGELQEVFE